MLLTYSSSLIWFEHFCLWVFLINNNNKKQNNNKILLLNIKSVLWFSIKPSHNKQQTKIKKWKRNLNKACFYDKMFYIINSYYNCVSVLLFFYCFLTFAVKFAERKIWKEILKKCMLLKKDRSKKKHSKRSECDQFVHW